MEAELFSLSIPETALRLDKALALRYPAYSRRYFQYLIAEGLVLVNGNLVKKSLSLSEEDEVEVTFAPLPEISLTPEAIPLDILFEDEELLAVNKPAGMVVHPACGNWSGTFVHALLYHCQSLPRASSLRPGIVHRLDKETSGVLLAAKNEQMQQKLIELFATRKIEKTYLALCVGNPGPREIEAPIGRHPLHRQKRAVVEKGRPSHTRCTPLHFSKKENLSLVSLSPTTGRTHQLRVHLHHIGFPILGDPLYGRSAINQKFYVSRQLLHAHSLRFLHPTSGEELLLSAPPPEDMQRLIDSLTSS